MQEYRDKPQNFVAPTGAEIKARTGRNVALALALLTFVILVFVTMVSRGVIPTPG